jgi:hypothetical protein
MTFGSQLPLPASADPMSEQTIAEQMRDYVKHEKRMTLYTADKLLRWADELAALSASGAGVDNSQNETTTKMKGRA